MKFGFGTPKTLTNKELLNMYKLVVVNGGDDELLTLFKDEIKSRLKRGNKSLLTLMKAQIKDLTK